MSATGDDRPAGRQCCAYCGAHTVDPGQPCCYVCNSTALGPEIDDGVRCELEQLVAASQFEQAWNDWSRMGGLVGPEPDPRVFAQRYCSQANAQACILACHEIHQTLLLLRRMLTDRRRREASLN